MLKIDIFLNIISELKLLKVHRKLRKIKNILTYPSICLENFCSWPKAEGVSLLTFPEAMNLHSKSVGDASVDHARVC